MCGYIKKLPSEKKALVLLLTLVVLAAVVGYYREKPQLPTIKPVVMTPASAVKNVPVEAVAVKNLKIYKKSALQKKVQLPEEVLADDNQQVTAVVDVPPTEGGAEVSSVTDVVTGETRIYAREKPLPFLDFENEKRIGVGYGVGTQGATAKIFASWSFLRVGHTHLSVEGEVNSSALRDPEAKASVVMDYRF